jgi:pilus assembly protein FimV
MRSVRARTPHPDRPHHGDHPDRDPICAAARALLGTALLCLSQLASAVSLGEIQTSSHIGDVLQARVVLTASPDEGVTADCIRLEGPRSEAADDLPWLRAGRIRLSTQADGQQVLLINSLQSIQSPVIMLAVRIDCNATLRREYTLLLNPPSGTDTTPQLAVPVAATSPADTSGNVWRAAKGESLRSIARNLFPTDKTLQTRYIALLRQHNVDKLQGIGDSTRLPAGIELAVPDANELSAAPAVTEPAPSRRSRQKTADTTNSEVTALPSHKSSGGQSRPRLIVGGDEHAGLQLATGLAGRQELSEKDREKLRTELQLIATLDDKIATQLELSEKLRRLEALQVQLQSDVQALEQNIHAQQTALQANAPSTAPAHLEASAPSAAAIQATNKPASAANTAGAGGTIDWQDWMLPIGGIVVLLVLLLGWQRYRSSHSYTDLPELAPLASEEQEPTGQPADDLFEPLSEEDIWPEAASVKRPAGNQPDTDLPSLSELGPPSVLHIEEDVEEHNSAVELAEIMMSFGRVQGAAQTLADFIRANPKQAVKPWVKLLEVYKTANMRPEFEALTSQLNKTFNVKASSWDDFDVAMRAPESLEHIGHIATTLCETWGKRECQVYLHGLLRDNRKGTRQGFPLAMVDEILLLLAILESQLGPYKHDVEPEPPMPPEPQTMTAPGVPQASTKPPVPFVPFEPEASAPTSFERKNERSALNFDIGTTDFDLGLNTEDLTRTLHINLDDLPDDPTRTDVRPRKPDEF